MFSSSYLFKHCTIFVSLSFFFIGFITRTVRDREEREREREREREFVNFSSLSVKPNEIHMCTQFFFQRIQ